MWLAAVIGAARIEYRAAVFVLTVVVVRVRIAPTLFAPMCGAPALVAIVVMRLRVLHDLRGCAIVAQAEIIGVRRHRSEREHRRTTQNTWDSHAFSLFNPVRLGRNAGQTIG
jgi:hypothetical protein